MEYINSKISEASSIVSKDNSFQGTSSNFIICTEDKNWENILSQKAEVNCVNINYAYKCFMNNNEGLNNNKYICNNCGKNFYKIDNDQNNNNSYINCYYNPEGYYLDEINSIYKSCYESCKTCNISGDYNEHNCFECKEEYIYEQNRTNYKNCYLNDPLYLTTFMVDHSASSELTSEINYTNENDKTNEVSQNKLVLDSIYTSYKTKIITNIITNKNSEINIINKKEITTNLITNYHGVISDIIADEIRVIKNRTELIQMIINNLLNKLNIIEINNGIDKTDSGDNLLVILTSTFNQKINKDKNNISINLGECENLLKEDYNISYNDSLYILQILYEEEGMKIPKVEYEIYYPLDNNNLTKLNLTICKDKKIEISIAVKIDDELDKYNSSGGYYNDICYKTTSGSGTDIILKDRRNEFIDNNMTLCEEKCVLIDYNYEKERAICSCDIKLSIPENYDIKFDKKEILKSIIDIKNIANLNILKCYKIVFKKKVL